MNKEPETYEELIRKKRCIDLTRYYELSEYDLNQIYDFLTTYPNGRVICRKQNISLSVPNNSSVALVIITQCISSSIDGIVMDNETFNIIPHYNPSSGSSGYSSSGGGSSNNNNNNNNNNNR